jgi:mRNA-degrading endonuclease toxin of MazEF toxin-antitoxin module
MIATVFTLTTRKKRSRSWIPRDSTAGWRRGRADAATGLTRVSHAMNEHVRAMASERAGRRLGQVSGDALTAISRYVHLFMA